MTFSTKMVFQNGGVLGTIIHDFDLVELGVSLFFWYPLTFLRMVSFFTCSRVFDYLDIWSTIFGPTHQLQT